MGSTKPSVEKVNTQTDEQQINLQQLNEALGGKLDDMMKNLGFDMQQDPSYQAGAQALGTQLSDFDPEQVSNVFEQNVGDPSRQAFNEQTLPGIQERYAGVGGARSSASQLAATGAATDLERQLSGQKSQTLLSAEQQKEQIRNQAIQQALQYASAPGQEGMSAIDRYTALMQQGQKSPYEIGVNQGSAGIWPDLIKAGGTAIGGMAGGPMGAAAGSAVSNYFTGGK